MELDQKQDWDTVKDQDARALIAGRQGLIPCWEELAQIGQEGGSSGPVTAWGLLVAPLSGRPAHSLASRAGQCQTLHLNMGSAGINRAGARQSDAPDTRCT